MKQQLLLGCLVLALGCQSGNPKPGGAGTSPIAVLKKGDVVSATFRKDDSLQLYLRDPKGVAERLQNESLVAELIKLAEMEVPAWGDELGWAPEELALSLSPSTIDALDHLGLAAIHSVFALAAQISDNNTDAAQFRETIGAELSKLGSVSVVVSARFVDEAAAKRAVAWLQDEAGRVGVPLRGGPEEFTGRITGKGIVGEDVVAALVGMGMARGPNDAGLAGLANAIERIAVPVKGKRFGKILRLEFGATGGALVGKSLAQKPHMHLRWEMPRLRDRMQRWLKALNSIRATKTGRFMATFTDSMGELNEMLSDKGPIPLKGLSTAVWDDSLRVRLETTGTPRRPISGDLARHVLPNAGMRIVDDEMTMVSGLHRMVEYVEQRVGPTLAVLADSAEARMYRDILSRLNRALAKPRSGALSGPSALVVLGTGRLDEVGGKIAGVSKTFPVGVDIPEIAMIGTSRDRRAARAWLKRVGTELVTTMAHLNRRGDRAKVWLDKVNLGLGKPTYELRTDLWATLAGVGILPVKAKVKGTLRPHWVEAGELVIFSTSERLTRRILASKSPPPGAKVVAYGAIRGSFVARVLEMLVQWGRLAGQDLSMLNQVAPLLRKRDGATWTSRYDQGTTITEFELR